MDDEKEKHRNSDDLYSRVAAVDKITDQAQFAEIARNDGNEGVRARAVARLDDEAVLAEIAKTDKSRSVRQLAVEKITDQELLLKIARDEGNYEFHTRQWAVAFLKDQGVIATIAQRDPDPRVRVVAVRALDDRAVIAEIAKSGGEKITDKYDVYGNGKPNDAVRSAAESRLGFLHERDVECAMLARLRERKAALAELLAKCSDHRGYEDPIYRFYHQSFKVYRLQERTREIVSALADLAPDREMNRWFLEIVSAGTGKDFSNDDNAHWTEVTRPIVEAFFHARFFLEMAIRYADLEEPPRPLPSGYATLLYLYRLR